MLWKPIAALSLATDLGIGVPLEHGLDSTLVAMRLCERLGVAMTEPRPHRPALPPDRAAEALGSGSPRIQRPASLSKREAEVAGLLARGLQTKQVARALGISVKTADRHIQNAYGKLGISTRAAATLFAMEHGLLAWGELPVPRTARRS